MEQGAVMMTGLGSEKVLQSLSILDSQKRGKDRDLMSVYDYSIPNVSKKVLRIIHSYVDYINKSVWKKNLD
jgi:UDP-N-acetyl-L-fucosamine synthase